MFDRAIAATLAACLLFAANLSATDVDPLTELRAYLDRLETLEAAFEQEVLDGDGQVVDLSSGTLQIKKPGRFRWRYEQPYEREVTADGERVWIYEADLDQVTVRRLDAQLGETPAALLAGEAGALEQFQHVKSFVAEGQQWVTLRPNDANADFSAISLALGEGDLKWLELRDKLGQRTRLRLFNIRRNEAIADELFDFDVPPEADVIGEADL